MENTFSDLRACFRLYHFIINPSYENYIEIFESFFFNDLGIESQFN